MSAPSIGVPLRRSSFFEMVKHGIPLNELISASAMRDHAEASVLVKVASRQRIR